jgi:glycosyltransferase involved in cell wall biosynthesis
VLPFRGDEPFGLVSVEAMACGTPVVGLANGALPEIVRPGVNGYLATDEADLARLTMEAAKLDRAAVRAAAVERFDVSAVARAYARLYARVADAPAG